MTHSSQGSPSHPWQGGRYAPVTLPRVRPITHSIYVPTLLSSFPNRPSDNVIPTQGNMLVFNTGLSSRSVNTVRTWRHPVPRSWRGCTSRNHTFLFLQSIWHPLNPFYMINIRGRKTVQWAGSHGLWCFQLESEGTSSIIHDFTSSKICALVLDWQKEKGVSKVLSLSQFISFFNVIGRFMFFFIKFLKPFHADLSTLPISVCLTN